MGTEVSVKLDANKFLEDLFPEYFVRDVVYQLDSISPEANLALNNRVQSVFGLIYGSVRAMLQDMVGLNKEEIAFVGGWVGRFDDGYSPINVKILSIQNRRWYHDNCGPEHPDIAKRLLKQKRVAAAISECIQARSGLLQRHTWATDVKIYVVDGASHSG